MKDYLEFVWQSAIHPDSFLDLIPAVQLMLTAICWYYIVKIFIEIYKTNTHGKK